MADKRDETTWVVLELTHLGEQKASEGKLVPVLLRDLALPEGHPVFVPYSSYRKGGRDICIKLIEGYAFVAAGAPEVRYFALESKQLVKKVLSSRGRNGLRVLQTLPNDKIEDLRSQLRGIIRSDIEPGSTVRVLEGNYANLEGEVVDVYDRQVAVRIQLRSVDLITLVPKSAVDPHPHDSADAEKVPEMASYEELSEAVAVAEDYYR